AFICFTSGTTGRPKGAIITHAMATAMHDQFQLGGEHGSSVAFGPDDVHLSYLPMAHVCEIVLQVSSLAVGARIGFWQGDPRKLMSDVAELKPTSFAATPMMYNRIYDRVWQQVSKEGWIKAAMFHAGYKSKLTWLSGNFHSHAIWDKAVFAPLKQLLGGRVRVLFSGSAPILPEVVSFLSIAFSCPVIIGYGLTEGMGGQTMTLLNDRTSTGTVGIPVPSVQIKLVDVPEMGYLTSNNPQSGEICFKGATAFPGYLDDEPATRETIDAEGWVHTGDIGSWDASGNLRIVDRKKSLFKLAQGEYVSPEKVETVYALHELVKDVFVTGDSARPFLVAVIHPHRERLLELAGRVMGEAAVKRVTYERLCEDPDVRAAVVDLLSGWVAGRGDLLGFEVVRNVALVPAPFPDETRTATDKKIRHVAKKVYEAKIKAMYNEAR
ncbi:hypothetical protein BDK51DRAFT_20393, partial [Blyttiomyces helicus]